MNKLSILILTHNEENNISKCLQSILPLTHNIFVVDSGSDDKTVEICRQYGAQVAIHNWVTYADQFNWGLDYFDFPSEWIMRLDADEEITVGLVNKLQQFLDSPDENIDGIYIRRQIYFMGRWIRYGGIYPAWMLRIFRNGIGRCEALWMDEHIVVGEGGTIKIHEDIIDKNNKDLTFWTDKHNKYASREILDIIGKKNTLVGCDNVIEEKLFGTQAQSRRWLKDNVYSRVPLFIRPFMYFIYRYVVRLGFLDGKEGLIFHFLQGFWYRFLVDAKLLEYERQQLKSKI